MVNANVLAVIQNDELRARDGNRRQIIDEYDQQRGSLLVARKAVAKSVATDERLRYLVPFRPPADTATYVHMLRERGHRMAVLADDGEKFGGWPGTKEWVYERGWLRQFLDMVDQLRAAGALMLATTGQVVREVPSAGLAYLPTASYREMEGWALWPEAARRLRSLETEFGEDRLAGPDGTLVRGTHWLNFLAKYPESNRMHKKMLRLSQFARKAGDPPAARRAN